MSKILTRILQLVLFVTVAVVLLFYAFRGVDMSDFVQKAFSARWSFVFLSLVFGWTAFIFRGYRWKLLIEATGNKVSFWHTYHSVLIGYLANFLFPRLGEFMRCVSVNKFDGVPIDKVVGTVIVERVFDLFVVILMALVFLLFRQDLILDFLHEANINISGHQILVWIVFGVLGLFLFFALVSHFACKYSAKYKWLDKILGIIKGLGDGLSSAWKLKKRSGFLLCTLGLWFSYLMTEVMLFYAIDSLSHLTIIDGIFILIIASFAFVIPAQGGLGSYHLAVSLGLTLYGIDKADGLLYATLSHGTQYAMAIILGAISVVILSIYRKKNAIPSHD